MTGMDWSNIDQALAHQHSLLKEAEKFHQANAGIRAARAARSNRAGARRDRRLRAQPASLRPGVAPQPHGVALVDVDRFEIVDLFAD